MSEIKCPDCGKVVAQVWPPTEDDFEYELERQGQYDRALLRAFARWLTKHEMLQEWSEEYQQYETCLGDWDTEKVDRFLKERDGEK